MPPLLEIIDLSHNFGGLQAIADFSLQVEAGELVGLIGPNGAGKTTIFNLITGVFRINQGRILLQGQDISAWRSHRITAAGIARTFQNIRLFKDLSVLDNVRLGAFAQHRYGLFDALRRSRTFQAEEGRLAHRAWELLERFQLIRIIRELQDEFRLTIILIEHQMRVVLNLCQRVTVLDFGCTIAAGPPQEIQHHPAVLEAYLGRDSSLGEEKPETNATALA